MSLQIVQFTAMSDHVADVETGIEKLFGAVEAAAPEQVQYLAARTALPGWTMTAPTPRAMTVLGNYRMLNAE
jgi:hypothetical protein